MTSGNSYLDVCGWTSFDISLFLNEPGRQSRDVGDSFVRLLRDFSKGNRVLELCCGAGRLCIDLARAGYEVTGLDLDERILEVFADRLAREEREVRERVTVVRGDMRFLEIGERFDFVILEDDSFVYLVSHRDQSACLGRVHGHLVANGHFFLAFTTPQRELSAAEDYEYDPIQQVKTLHCSWAAVDERGNHTAIRQGFERRRLVYPCELELLLAAAGFEIVHRWGDLDRTPFQYPEKQDYHYLMRKA